MRRFSPGEVLDGDGDGAIVTVLDSLMWCVSVKGSEVQSLQFDVFDVFRA